MVYVVERYLPGLSHSDLLRGLLSLQTLEDLEADGPVVRYLGSTIVLEDEACFCEFTGPSEAAVAEANRRAGLSFDRIVPALTVKTKRRGAVNVSTTIPATVQIRRGQLIALIATAAAFAAVITWLLVTFAFDSNATTVQSVSGRTAITSAAIPVTGYLSAITGAPAPTVSISTPLSPSAQATQSVPWLMSLTPARLAAGALGSSYALPSPQHGPTLASVLASMTPETRRYTQRIMSLTFAQLAAGAAGSP